MSYNDYLSAMEQAKKCNRYRVAKGTTPEAIKESERLLKLSFSKQLQDFYSKYGYLSFFGTEIFGIYPDDLEDVLEGNSVAYALHERENYNLPDKWIPFYSFGDGSLACFDYEQLNDDAEPRVIRVIYDGHSYSVVECVADDFGGFVLELVSQQLQRQV